MAGHSKWANIKHRKGAQDAKRAKFFTKAVKELTIASKVGGPDPDANPRLRMAIQNAKAVNLPKENMERAIKKGSGDDGTNYDEVNYEGYGPHGVAIYVECSTDNVNRTVSNVRSYFTKFDGNVGTNGSLDFIFDRKGVFTVEAGELDEDDFTLEAIDGGAEDVVKEDDVFMVYTPYDEFGNMQKKLEELGVEIKTSVLERIPKTTVTLDVNGAQTILKLVDLIEEDDDVQNVFHNLELTEELMAELQ